MLASAAIVMEFIFVGFALALLTTTVVGNWQVAIINGINRRKGIDRSHSLVPLLSLLFALLAYILCQRSWRHWIWLIPACDIGYWIVLFLPLGFIKKAWLKRMSAIAADKANEGNTHE